MTSFVLCFLQCAIAASSLGRLVFLPLSERTKAALAAAKERGIELGKNGKVLAKANRNEAIKFADLIGAQLNGLGIITDMTMSEIANRLNQAGIKTRQGGTWHNSTVSRLLKRRS